MNETNSNFANKARTWTTKRPIKPNAVSIKPPLRYRAVSSPHANRQGRSSIRLVMPLVKFVISRATYPTPSSATPTTIR
jgi:hypothetical protein